MKNSNKNLPNLFKKIPQEGKVFLAIATPLTMLYWYYIFNVILIKSISQQNYLAIVNISILFGIQLSVIFYLKMARSPIPISLQRVFGGIIGYAGMWQILLLILVFGSR